MRAQFSTVLSLKTGVDETKGVLNGAIIVSKGEAKGHGFYIGDMFLDAVAKLKTLAFRVDPPGEDVHGGAMAIEGEATNFRRDGDDVRADIQLFALPGGQRDRVLKLAQSAAHLVGLSLDITYKVLRTLPSKLKEIIPTTITAVDLVKDPAAARALFSTPVDIEHGEDMNYTFLRNQCAKFSIAFPAEDKDVTADIAAKAESDLSAKLATLQTDSVQLSEKVTDLTTQLDAAKKSGGFDYDALCAKLQAKGLAVVGQTPPAKGNPTGDEGKPKTDDSAVARLALRLGRKPEELTVQLAALPDDETRAFAVKHNIDPVLYAANIARHKASRN